MHQQVHCHLLFSPFMCLLLLLLLLLLLHYHARSLWASGTPWTWSTRSRTQDWAAWSSSAW
jgi:hypothetical protein